jgi:poly(3-hydroxybutyrate) depolymerase
MAPRPALQGFALAIGLLATVAGGQTTVSVNPSWATVPIPTYVEIQNRVSKTRQFSATVRGSRNQNVTWKLCADSRCFEAGVSSQYGVISATGLYTAPLYYPNPPTLRVVAQADAGTGSATLTVDRGITWTTTNSTRTGPCPFAQILASKGTDFDCHYTISSDKVERDVRIRVGSNYVPGNGGVIHFHGSGNTYNPGICAQAEAGGNWMQGGDRHGLVVMCPHGIGGKVQGWYSWWTPATSAWVQDADDAGFAWALLSDMVTQFQVDPRNRHTVGISGGANIQTRLAIEDGALLGSLGWVDGSHTNFDSRDSLCGSACVGRNLPALNYPLSVLIIRGTCNAPFRCSTQDILPYCSTNSHSATMEEDFEYYSRQLETGTAVPNTTSLCPKGRGGSEGTETYKKADRGKNRMEIRTYVLTNGKHRWYPRQDISGSGGGPHNPQLRADFPQATPNPACTYGFCTG